MRRLHKSAGEENINIVMNGHFGQASIAFLQMLLLNMKCKFQFDKLKSKNVSLLTCTMIAIGFSRSTSGE